MERGEKGEDEEEEEESDKFVSTGARGQFGNKCVVLYLYLQKIYRGPRENQKLQDP